ncbi:MAG: DUF6285 domain-containing protein [Dongiaceae bacterium]
MTLDHATGDELLAEARRTLLERILPALPPDLRYEGAMIANAMAIAMREIIDGSAATNAVLGALSGLYGDAQTARPSESADAALARLEQRLASDLRKGVFDAPDAAREQVRHALRAATVARLTLSNPKVLLDGKEGRNK